MQLPFTSAEFLDVFAQYNRTVWPAQVFLVALGVALALVAWFRPPRSVLVVGLGLALLWGWMGAVYHIGFFRRINPAAGFFGIAFLVQALLFLIWGVTSRSRNLAPVKGPQAWLALLLLGYALVIYPLLGWMLGHRYPSAPTFGLPCPTTIATLGLLVAMNSRPPWWLYLIPMLWVLVGSSAAFGLGIREDLGLLAAGVIAGAWSLARAGDDSGTAASAFN
jgi:hypothetical protein